MLSNIPSVSIIIPTLNAEKVLNTCLESIAAQHYSKERYEIIVADGGSTDSTLEIAKKYGCIILPNPLKTGEAGKMVGLKASKNQYVCFIDSDNVLPDPDWLLRMIEPLMKNYTAVGSEPLEYTYRPKDGFITRYCALIGMNDPLVMFMGNYDRTCLITGKWTEIPHEESDHETYLLATFNKTDGMPTIGANGTVLERDFLMRHVEGDYLFDIDVLAKALQDMQVLSFIKVKTGIVHSYCESDISKFARKQARRVKDFMFHKSQGTRSYKWVEGFFNRQNLGLVSFILCCITVVPLFIQALIGFVKKPDWAWFFHVLACEITFFQYSTGVIGGKFNAKEADRSQWKQ